MRHTAWRRLWRAAWDGAVREARKRQRRQMPRTTARAVDAPRHCVGGGQCSGGAAGLSRGGSAPEEQMRSWVPECGVMEAVNYFYRYWTPRLTPRLPRGCSSYLGFV